MPAVFANSLDFWRSASGIHDPHETSPDILQLRALHAAMNRAVLEAYGWHDLARNRHPWRARCGSTTGRLPCLIRPQTTISRRFVTSSLSTSNHFP